MLSYCRVVDVTERGGAMERGSILSSGWEERKGVLSVCVCVGSFG